MIPIAVCFLIGEKIVLSPVAAFNALGQLGLSRIEAAITKPCLVVVSTRAGQHIDVAGNVVQAIARITGATHDLDAVQLHGENHVHVRHVAVVAVAWDSVDQQFDSVHFAFAVEASKGDFAGGGALVEFCQHNPWCAPEQLPAVVDRHLFKYVSTQNIN
ncbi:hypothetical protein D3C85_952840 [compost metagenome]